MARIKTIRNKKQNVNAIKLSLHYENEFHLSNNLIIQYAPKRDVNYSADRNEI